MDHSKRLYPLWDHAKHVLAGAAVFLLIFAIALFFDFSARELVRRKIIEDSSFLFWTLMIAKSVLLVSEVVALVVLVCKRSWDFVKGLFP